MIALVEVTQARRDALRRELSEYLVELAENEGVSVTRSPNGEPAYRWFDDYWLSDDRLPFFIEVEGVVGGFCLIRMLDSAWNIAEFGVRPEQRRQRVGHRTVGALANQARSSGADHLRADVHDWNEPALRFWTACGFHRVQTADGIIQTQFPLEPGG